MRKLPKRPKLGIKFPAETKHRDVSEEVKKQAESSRIERDRKSQLETFSEAERLSKLEKDIPEDGA